MIAVIFEVIPKPEHIQEYLDIAATLRPELEKYEGFISIERFSSLTTEGKVLSLSFWRDEESVKKWREFNSHHEAQIKGRNELFIDYRIRVSQVVRDYGLLDRQDAPKSFSEK